MERSRIRLALVTLAAATLLVLLLRNAPDGAESSTPARPAAAARDEAIEPRPAAVGTSIPASPSASGDSNGLRSGDVLVYDAQAWFRVEAQPSLEGMGDAPIARSVTLRGSLEERVLERDEQGTWLAGSIADAEISVALGRETVAVPGDALEGLARGVLVRLGPDLGLVETRFDARLGAEERNLLRALLGWIHQPAAAIAAGGLVDEEDVSGRYQAVYETRTAPGGIEFSRRKPTYASAWATEGQAAPVVDSAESLLEGLFDPGRGIVVRVRSQERLEYRPEEAFRRMSCESSGRVELREVSHDPSTDAARLEELLASTVAASPVRPDVDDRAGESRPRIPSRLAAVPVEELPGMLADLVRQDRFRSEESWTIFQALAAHLELEPELARSFRAWILAGDLASEVRSALVTSLGAAGTPEAQEVLAGLLEDRRTGGEVREAATFAVHQVERPTARIEQALREQALSGGEGAGHALFALGTVLGRTKGDRARSQQTLEFLRDVAATTSDEATRLTAIEALGNSKSELVHADLVDHADRGRPADERRAAARALATLDLPRSREYLAAELATETDPAVRTTAVGSLAGHAKYVPLVADVALRDEDAAVRRAALHALAEGSDRAARAAVERVREEGPDAELREEAARLLEARG